MTYIVTYLSSPTLTCPSCMIFKKHVEHKVKWKQRPWKSPVASLWLISKLTSSWIQKKHNTSQETVFILNKLWAVGPPPQCGTYFRPKQVNKVRKQDIRTHTQYKLHLPIRIRSLPAWLNDSDNTFLWELNNIYVTLIRYETSSPFLLKDTWELQKIINSRFYLNIPQPLMW